MNRVTYDVDPQLRAEFIDESLEGLASLSSLYVTLESDPTHVDTVQAIFRVVHSIKGSAAYFELMKIKSLAHELETLLDMVRTGTLSASPDIVDTLLAGTDSLTVMFDRARRQEQEIEDQGEFDALVGRVTSAAQAKPVGEGPLWSGLLDSLTAIGDRKSVV